MSIINVNNNNKANMIRIKQIQKCNEHVDKIIKSAKKLIQNQNISNEEKDKLQIKISIENDHLKNSFYKINTPNHIYQIQLNNYVSNQSNYQRKYSNNRSYQSHKIKQQDNPLVQYIDDKTKITISRKKDYLLHSQSNTHRSYQPSKSIYQPDTTFAYDHEKSFFKTPSYIQSKHHDSLNQEDSFNQIKQIKNFTSNKQQHLTQKKHQQAKISYIQIIEKNKQKLFSVESKKYQIHLERLQQKKQSRKKILSNSPQSKNLKSVQRLHSSRLKNNQCEKCLKDRHKHFPQKQSKQKFQNYHLVKKYLTEEGEKQCFNFLRSQGIPESEWGTYITQYVYKQLSKLYQKRIAGQN